MKNETMQTTETQMADDRVVVTGLYCIKVQANNECWIADWDGDPGRTIVKENAKTFKRKLDAEKLCNKMKVKYPNRNVWVDVF